MMVEAQAVAEKLGVRFPIDVDQRIAGAGGGRRAQDLDAAGPRARPADGDRRARHRRAGDGPPGGVPTPAIDAVLALVRRQARLRCGPALALPLRGTVPAKQAGGLVAPTIATPLPGSFLRRPPLPPQGGTLRIAASLAATFPMPAPLLSLKNIALTSAARPCSTAPSWPSARASGWPGRPQRLGQVDPAEDRRRADRARPRRRASCSPAPPSATCRRSRTSPASRRPLAYRRGGPRRRATTRTARAICSSSSG